MAKANAKPTKLEAERDRFEAAFNELRAAIEDAGGPSSALFYNGERLDWIKAAREARDERDKEKAALRRAGEALRGMCNVIVAAERGRP